MQFARTPLGSSPFRGANGNRSTHFLSWAAPAKDTLQALRASSPQGELNIHRAAAFLWYDDPGTISSLIRVSGQAGSPQSHEALWGENERRSERDFGFSRRRGIRSP